MLHAVKWNCLRDVKELKSTHWMEWRGGYWRGPFRVEWWEQEADSGTANLPNFSQFNSFYRRLLGSFGTSCSARVPITSLHVNAGTAARGVQCGGVRSGIRWVVVRSYQVESGVPWECTKHVQSLWIQPYSTICWLVSVTKNIWGGQVSWKYTQKIKRKYTQIYYRKWKICSILK